VEYPTVADAVIETLVATEEPDEGNLHVQICGEGAG
jgi:hypothetical protein